MKLTIPKSGLFLSAGEDFEPSGPFTLSEVKAKYAGGEVTAATFLWFEGLENWVAVGDIPEIDRRHAISPPPLPQDSKITYVTKDGLQQVKSNEIHELRSKKNLRRTDLVSERRWVRADQHKDVRRVFRSPKLPKISAKLTLQNTWVLSAAFGVIFLIVASAFAGAGLYALTFDPYVFYEDVNPRTAWNGYDRAPAQAAPMVYGPEMKKRYSERWLQYLNGWSRGLNPEEKGDWAQNLEDLLIQENAKQKPDANFVINYAMSIRAGKAFWLKVDRPRLMSKVLFYGSLSLLASLFCLFFAGLTFRRTF